ncbi:MAG: (2Fe-2S)-binding protein [Bosea sp. (in: a-proteobacteria)]|uniref:(2Fe-2S)-binding protein n=1 Tax=Bosea sp. (in: a-proteobacteria) TaxID=1871050 RepID=UPI003F7B6F30
MSESIELRVNGQCHVLPVPGNANLLDVLRNRLGLKAARFGCGEGLCGACRVLVDGQPMPACDTPLWAVAGRSVTTVEGLGTPQKPHPIQKALIEEQAMQCGYCISGIMISAVALLQTNTHPSDADIRAALDDNLCRCGAHNRILRAVRRAAEELRAAEPHDA